MLFQLIAFGKLLYAGIIAYRSGDYLKSQSKFERALLINPTDFTANFWMLRASALQGNFDRAIHYLSICRKWAATPKVESLLIPWEQYCLRPATQLPEVELLNSQTDELLEYFQHFREFRISDILKSFLLSYGILFICVVLQLISIIPKNMSGMMVSSIALFFGAPLVICYYYQKPVLIPNVVVLFYYCLSKVRGLLHSRIFIYTCFVIFVVLLLFGNRSSGPNLEVIENYATIFSVIILTPIVEEIVMRGVLYGYLRRYGKTLAWVVVTMVFYLSHGDSSSFFHIFFSLVCLNVYDNEKTILAPILLHSISNGIITLLILLH